MAHILPRLAAAAALVVLTCPPSSSGAACSTLSAAAPRDARTTTATHPMTAPHLTAASRVTAEVSSVSPHVAHSGRDVTITLSVHNTGATTLTGVHAVATLSGQRIVERGQIDRWLASTDPPSSVVAEVSGGSTTLGPGATGSFSVTVPAARWRTGRPFAAIPVVVTVRSGDDAVGSARTVVPWVSDTEEYTALHLAWAVPLSVPIDERLYSASGPVSVQAWEGALGPASMARRRLAAAGSTPVTWLVDPTLVDGHRLVATSASAASPATRVDTAPVDAATKDLAAALSAIPATQSIWALPPGDPDTAALLDRTPSPELAALVYPTGPSALDTALSQNLPRSTAWPADGQWSSGREAAWRTATASYPMTAALVSSSGIVTSKGYTSGATHRSDGGTGLLVYDEGLSDIAGGRRSPAGQSSPEQTTQRFLAESIVLLGERPGTTRGTLVAIPRDSTVSDATLRALWAATAEAPWLRSTTLPALAAEVPTASVVTTKNPGTDATPPSPLVDGAVDDVERGVRRARGLRDVLPAQGDALADLAAVTEAQLLSARWRGHQREWSVVAQGLGARLDQATGSVSVAPSVPVTFLADAGTVSITVSNDLPYTVSDVRLTLTPSSPKLRVVHQPGPLTIRARSRADVRVEVNALGAGDVTVVARLATPSGVELGTPRTKTMTVRPTGEWIRYIYGAGALVALVLVAGLARTLTRKPTRAVRDDLA